MIKTIHENWLKEFKTELHNTNTVCIVSPFITDNIVNKLLTNSKGKTIKVITRYNLNEFKQGVSSLTAIERLLKSNAQIKSVKRLHSKLYLFDQKSVIITSANFTNGGFIKNKEFGILSTESSTVNESLDYFNDLWKIDPNLLNQKIVNDWKVLISKFPATKNKNDELPDFGQSYVDSVLKERRYFVKFFGKSNIRENVEHKVINEINGGCSHFALSFSRPKNNARPRRYRDGDIVFMARMTENPNDYAIFGRAETIAHDEKRDVASKKDIDNIKWLKDWPILVRVKKPVFLDAQYKNCPKLYDLMDDLDYDSFSSTKKKYSKGDRNINPKNSLMRKGDVILSDEGALWMENQFNKAIDINGIIDDKYIKSLYQSIKI